MEESEILALVSLLDDDDLEIFDEVEKKIVSLGVDVIPLLEKEWEKNKNPEVQKRIENLIHRLQYERVHHALIDWKNQGGKDLLKGMHLIATYQYPDLNYLSLKQQIDQLYYEALKTVKNNVHPYDQIRLLNHFFFIKNKFKPNKKSFYAPNNSFLNVVLETRKGIPLTLSVIYSIIAKMLGMPVYGVNLPNLFVLTYKGHEKQFYINVYNSGLIFTKEDIENYVKELNLNPNQIFFQPCTNIDIVKRCLRNLITAFEHSNEPHRKKEIEQILIDLSEKDEIV